MPRVRALIVIAGFLALTGIAAAATATPTPTTIERTSAPVEALAQDGGQLAWLAGDGNKCNTVHMSNGVTTSVIPQPPNGMTCHWDMSGGGEQLAIAAGASAALWTLHQRGSDFVMTAQVGGEEVQVDRLAHQSNGTGWWLGGTTGKGTSLAYSSVDVEYVDPLACASGGSCKRKIAGGGIEVVAAGQKTPLPNSVPALDLAVSNGRIAYIPATTVTKKGAPASSSTAPVLVEDISSGAVISEANPVGVPIAIGLSSHVLAVLSRGTSGARSLRLTWYDPSTGQKLGEVAVSGDTAPELAVNDQVIVFRFVRKLRALVVATGRVRSLGKTAPVHLGLSLDGNRLVWAENGRKSGRIRALSVA